MKTWPYPAGTLTLGLHRNDKLPVRSLCRHHIFEVGDAIENPFYLENFNCQYKQRARCLICQDGWTALVDADWWYYLPDGFDIASCMGEMAAIEQGFADARRIINQSVTDSWSDATQYVDVE